jgi:hypothetical protein
LTALRQQAAAYPFLTALDEPIETIKAIAGQPYAFYLMELRPREDALLDLKENALDPIRRFMSGPLKVIYDDARRFLAAQETNFSYVGGEEAEALTAILSDPHCYQGNKMQEAKRLLDELQRQVAAQVQAEKARAIAALEDRWQRLANTDEFAAITEQQQAVIQEAFADAQRMIERPGLIAVIRDTVNRFEQTGYPHLLRLMTEWAKPVMMVDDEESQVGTPIHEVEYISHHELTISFGQPWLANEEDVDVYLCLLKEKMLAVIKEGKRVQV